MPGETSEVFRSLSTGQLRDVSVTVPLELSAGTSAGHETDRFDSFADSTMDWLRGHVSPKDGASASTAKKNTAGNRKERRCHGGGGSGCGWVYMKEKDRGREAERQRQRQRQRERARESQRDNGARVAHRLAKSPHKHSLACGL